MEPKKLNIPNHNNVLACDVFATINYAPVREKMPLWNEVEKQVYFIEHQDNRIYLQLVEITLYKFKDIPYWITLLCNGLFADEWRNLWQQGHPEVTTETGMAIYFYRKINL